LTRAIRALFIGGGNKNSKKMLYKGMSFL